ncbi:hypothetical protein QUB05_05270 [Microcoleus sp. F10-C6]
MFSDIRSRVRSRQKSVWVSCNGFQGSDRLNGDGSIGYNPVSRARL